MSNKRVSVHVPPRGIAVGDVVRVRRDALDDLARHAGRIGALVEEDSSNGDLVIVFSDEEPDAADVGRGDLEHVTYAERLAWLQRFAPHRLNQDLLELAEMTKAALPFLDAKAPMPRA